MILSGIFVLLLLAAAFKYFSQKRMRDAVANLDGPFCLPLLGAVQHFTALSPENFLEKSELMKQKYGQVMAVWALTRLIIVSGDVELNEQLLSSQQHIVKHRNYRMLHPWLGTGLLMSDGRKWFQRRKIITPAFHFKILEQFIEIFDQQSSILVEKLRSKADGRSPFDVAPFICLAALDIIAETAMGTKVYAQQKSSEYIVAVNRLTKLMAWRFMKVLLNSELAFTLLCPHLKWRQERLIRTLHAFTRRVIEERRAELTKELSGRKDETERRHMALLDILLQSSIEGKPLSNEDIREEVDTFMFEGHDTTTSAICFALYYLARHRAVQERVLQEWQAIVGKERLQQQQLTMRALNELKYLECVIKETLRMYPSVPIIGRELDEDFHYNHSRLGKGCIPAGAEFFVFIHGMMHNAANFPNPDTFDPDRHLETNSHGAFALIPFSAGPRNCIGQKFAMLEMKVIIGKILENFELLPLGNELKPELNIVMRSSNGFQLGMRCRTS